MRRNIARSYNKSVPFTNWVGTRGERAGMRAFVAVIVGVVLFGYSVYQGLIKQDISYREGRRVGSRRYVHLRGQDAVLAGGLGAIAGAALVGFGIYVFKSQPPIDP
jgi:hypothetical protein